MGSEFWFGNRSTSTSNTWAMRRSASAILVKKCGVHEAAAARTSSRRRELKKSTLFFFPAEAA
jgi:hypothetical protein